MLSLQEAMQLDFTGGLTDMDVGFGFGFGFDEFGSDSNRNTMTESCTPPVDVGQAIEEEERQRRLRRKISNRESARRSRARKQQQMEELQRSVEALRAENRSLAARLNAAARRALAVRRDNARLHAEASALAARLDAAARRALAVRRDNARLHAEASALRRWLGEAQSNAAVLLGLSGLLRTAGQGGGVNGAVRGRTQAVSPQLAGGMASLMT